MKTPPSILQYMLLSVIVLASCGNLDTMISTSGAYTVGAYADGQDIERNGIIVSGAVLRPFYVPESGMDPDVVSMRLLLRDEHGEDAASAVEYRERRALDRGIADEGASRMIVDSLSETLPSFSFPPELAIGRYELTFQLLGEDAVLHESSYPLFYIGDATFELSSLISYPPGTGPSSDAPVFRADVPLLLEAQIDVGDELDPYLVWSFAGNRLSEGRVAEIGARLLWTPPSLAGLYRIDVTLFPVPPLEGEETTLGGLSRSITVATSPDAPYPGLSGSGGEFTRLHRFLGSLTDQGTEAASGTPLTAIENAEAEWLPTADGYGILIGVGRSYQAAAPIVPVNEGVVSPGRLSFLLSPRGYGRLFRAEFASEDGADPALVLDLSLTELGPAAVIRSRSTTDEATDAAEVVESAEVAGSPLTLNNDTHLIELVFYSRNGGFFFYLTTDGVQSEVAGVAAPEQLTGTGFFALGQPIDDGDREILGSLEAEGSGAERSSSVEPIAVVDDFAVSAFTPPLEEEPESLESPDSPRAVEADTPSADQDSVAAAS